MSRLRRWVLLVPPLLVWMLLSIPASSQVQPNPAPIANGAASRPSILYTLPPGGPDGGIECMPDLFADAGMLGMILGNATYVITNIDTNPIYETTTTYYQDGGGYSLKTLGNPNTDWDVIPGGGRVFLTLNNQNPTAGNTVCFQSVLGGAILRIWGFN